MAGCSVLTRPSIISGKPVTSDTFVTDKPSDCNNLEVPPVDMTSMRRFARARASSTTPDLSETLRIARILLILLDISQFDPYYSRWRWAGQRRMPRPRTRGLFLCPPHLFLFLKWMGWAGITRSYR